MASRTPSRVDATDLAEESGELAEVAEGFDDDEFDDEPDESELSDGDSDDLSQDDMAEEGDDTELAPEELAETELPSDDPDGDDEDVTVATAIVSPDAAFDDDDDELVSVVVGDDDGDDEGEVEGLRDGEFVCRSCHLARRETQLADAKRMLCRDCV